MKWAGNDDQFSSSEAAVAIVVIEFPQIIENWQQAKTEQHMDQKIDAINRKLPWLYQKKFLSELNANKADR